MLCFIFGYLSPFFSGECWSSGQLLITGLPGHLQFVASLFTLPSSGGGGGSRPGAHSAEQGPSLGTRSRICRFIGKEPCSRGSPFNPLRIERTYSIRPSNFRRTLQLHCTLSFSMIDVPAFWRKKQIQIIFKVSDSTTLYVHSFLRGQIFKTL